MKVVHQMKTGDIIKISPISARYFGETQYLRTVVEADNTLTAYTVNGDKVEGFPVDTIMFIKTQGSWWKVVLTKNLFETEKLDNNFIYYEISDKIEPYVVQNFEKDLSNLMQG